ncbi:MAG: GMC family oxidoreductase N-terminal domain-containing protein, partial [Myxococcota bacterium]
MTGPGAIVDGASWAADATEACDVLVIGSGCGGATLALALAERGIDVIVAERGGYYTAADFDQREANMLAKIDGGRGLDTSDDGGVAMTYGNNVGGASVHYWADSYRTPADRLAVWADQYGVEGHDLATLTPQFERLERDLNVHPAPDEYANRINVLVRDAAQRLGWKVDRVPQARKGCVSSGYCAQGCAYDAKQSQLVTHLPRAVALGARVFADLDLTRLYWNGPRVTSAVGLVLDRATGRPRGPTVRIEPKAVAVAAGGYGTPRLLLRQGLKDRLPALGEHLFVNPCPMVHGRFDEDIVQWRNIPAAWAVEEFRLARDEGGAYREGGYLLMPNQLQPATLAAVLSGIGPSHRRWMKAMPKVGGTIAWIDDRELGRMTLESAGRTRLHVILHGGNGDRIRDAFRKQAAVLLEAGAREVLLGDVAETTLTRRDQLDAAIAGLSIQPSRNVLAAPHPGGGARMG